MTITNTIKIIVEGTDVTSLVDSYTTPTRKLNSSSSFTFVIKDEDFSLYDDYINGTDETKWCDCQFSPVQVIDADTNESLFIGRVAIPTYEDRRIKIVCESIGKYLEDITMPSDLGIGNFIYADGKISDPSHDANADQVEVTDADGVAMTFTEDAYIGKGLLINDSTGEDEPLVWDAEDVLIADAEYNAFDSITDGGDETHEEDEVYCIGVRSAGNDSSAGKNCYLAFEMKGVTLPNDTPINRLEIKYNIRLETAVIDFRRKHTAVIYVWNYNTEDWDVLEVVYFWNTGSSPGVGYLKNTKVITDHPEYYLEDDTSDFVTIKLRVVYNTYLNTDHTTGNGYCKVDFLETKTYYQSDTFSAIQAEITDNGTDSITCNGETFEDDGVTIGDTFQVGASTTDILTAVFKYAKIPIDIDPTFSKFIARNFKGMNPLDVLNSICLVENAYWWEEYNSDGSYKIMIRKSSSFDYQVKEVKINIDFEDDTIGNFPEDAHWVKENDFVTVEGPIGGHDQVLQLYDLDDSRPYIDYIQTGMIVANKYYIMEFDIRTEDVTTASSVTQILFYKYGYGSFFSFYISLDKFYAMHDYPPIELQSAAADTWYHIKLIWNMYTYKCDIYIDDIYKNQIDIDSTYCDMLLIQNQNLADHKAFFDNFVLTEYYYQLSTVDRKSLSIERAANYYSSVRGLGNPLKAIDMIKSDISIASPLQKVIIDESINTMADMEQILIYKLDELKTLQESIKVTLNNDNNSYFKPGYNVYLNLTIPAKTGTYPIRRVDYEYKRVGLKQTILYLGMGHSPAEETFIENQKKMLDWARKAHLHAQNPNTVVSNLSYGDIYNTPDLTVYLKKDGTATQDLLLKDNEASALDIKEGANSYLKFITTNSGEKILLGQSMDFNNKTLSNHGLLPISNLETNPTNDATDKSPNSDWAYKIEYEAFTKAGVLTFSSFPITPSSAPTTDYQTANKKYVDDNKITVDDTPTDGHTTQAASSNAVYNHIIKHTYTFGATRSTAQTIETGSDTIVQYNTEVYDPSSSYNNTTYKFTAPATGVYHFDASVLFTSTSNWNAGETCEMIAYYDGGADKRMGTRDTIQVSGSYYWKVSISFDYKMTSGKTMEIRVFQSSGSNLNLFNSAPFNYFTGHWVSDG